MEQTFKISQINNLIIENNSVTEEKLSQDLRDKIDNKQDKGDYALVDSPQSFSGLQTFSEGILIDGTLTINGDIVQNGGSYETYTEQVYSTKDYIYLREGNLGALEEGSYSGFEFKNYDGTNNGRLVIDNRGIARVGDVGDEQPLATREEEPINGGFAKWDASTQKFITTTDVATKSQLNTKYTKPSNGIPESDLAEAVQQKLNSSTLTPEEIAAIRQLLAKVTIGDTVKFNTTVEAPIFNDLDE